MKTNKLHARMPYGWNDLGTVGLTEEGENVLVGLISKRLPEEIEWTYCDELIGPVDLEWDSDELENIIAEAVTELLEKYTDDKYYATEC